MYLGPLYNIEQDIPGDDLSEDEAEYDDGNSSFAEVDDLEDDGESSRLIINGQILQ